MLNHRSQKIPSIRVSRQRGVILVTSLLILLMVTMLAASAFNTSYIQTLIAGNIKFQTVSFNKAERALRDAETAIENMIAEAGFFDFSTAGDGYYNIGESLDVRALDWDNIAAVESGSEPGDKFVIQYYGRQEIPGSDQAAAGGSGAVIGSYVYTYVVTARSLTSKRAQRVVQSVYVTLEQP